MSTNGSNFERQYVTHTNLAYAAGIIDGEGSIYLGITRQKGRNPRVFAAMSVNMTSQEIPFTLKSWFGGGICIRSMEERANHKPVFAWSLSSQSLLITTIEGIFPYLILKKPQATLMLEYLRLPKSTSYNEKLEYHKAMGYLNKRGKLTEADIAVQDRLKNVILMQNVCQNI